MHLEKNNTESAAVLILNQYSSGNMPIIFNVNDTVTKVNFFIAPDTGIYRSCSAVFRGRMLILGGWLAPYDNQISEIMGSSLLRIGTFPTSVYTPACNTLSDNDPMVWICFNDETKNGCKTLVKLESLRFREQKIAVKLL